MDSSKSADVVAVNSLTFGISGRQILSDVSLSIARGSWLGVLGENGTGKTTLLDLIMGFKRPGSGEVSIWGSAPAADPFQDRTRIGYLSEKVDLPGDWSIGDFLAFNSHFYPTYDRAVEGELLKTLRVSRDSRIGNLSAGEIRRAQIVATLSYRPELIVVDEITAVLDIVGRRKFMGLLSDLRKGGATIVFATNILEGLHEHLTHLLLLQPGRAAKAIPTSEFVADGSEHSFINAVADRLEAV